MALASVTANAATIELDPTTGQVGATREVTVAGTVTEPAANQQITVLMHKAGEEPSEENIVGIMQFESLDDFEENFLMKQSAPAGEYTIKVGGTDVAVVQTATGDYAFFVIGDIAAQTVQKDATLDVKALLILTGEDSSDPASYAFVSDKPDIASVDPATGVVTGVAAGSATITATVTINGNAQTKEISVTVTDSSVPPVEGEGVDITSAVQKMVDGQPTNALTISGTVADYLKGKDIALTVSKAETITVENILDGSAGIIVLDQIVQTDNDTGAFSFELAYDDDLVTESAEYTVRANAMSSTVGPDVQKVSIQKVGGGTEPSDPVLAATITGVDDSYQADATVSLADANISLTVDSEPASPESVVWSATGVGQVTDNTLSFTGEGSATLTANVTYGGQSTTASKSITVTAVPAPSGTITLSDATAQVEGENAVRIAGSVTDPVAGEQVTVTVVKQATADAEAGQILDGNFLLGAAAADGSREILNAIALEQYSMESFVVDVETDGSFNNEIPFSDLATEWTGDGNYIVTVTRASNGDQAEKTIALTYIQEAVDPFITDLTATQTADTNTVVISGTLANGSGAETLTYIIYSGTEPAEWSAEAAGVVAYGTKDAVADGAFSIDATAAGYTSGAYNVAVKASAGVTAYTTVQLTVPVSYVAPTGISLDPAEDVTVAENGSVETPTVTVVTTNEGEMDPDVVAALEESITWSVENGSTTVTVTSEGVITIGTVPDDATVVEATLTATATHDTYTFIASKKITVMREASIQVDEAAMNQLAPKKLAAGESINLADVYEWVTLNPELDKLHQPVVEFTIDNTDAFTVASQDGNWTLTAKEEAQSPATVNVTLKITTALGTVEEEVLTLALREEFTPPEDLETPVANTISGFLSSDYNGEVTIDVYSGAVISGTNIDTSSATRYDTIVIDTATATPTEEGHYYFAASQLEEAPADGYQLVISVEGALPQLVNIPQSAFNPETGLLVNKMVVPFKPVLGKVTDDVVTEIDINDLTYVQNAIMGSILTGEVDETADLNGDGAVNAADLAILLNNFGKSVSSIQITWEDEEYDPGIDRSGQLPQVPEADDTAEEVVEEDAAEEMDVVEPEEPVTEEPAAPVEEESASEEPDMVVSDTEEAAGAAEGSDADADLLPEA